MKVLYCNGPPKQCASVFLLILCFGGISKVQGTEFVGMTVQTDGSYADPQDMQPVLMASTKKHDLCIVLYHDSTLTQGQAESAFEKMRSQTIKPVQDLNFSLDT
eukprot:Filipodium_phascolosomae@DN5142_c0_g1_i1.p1